MVSYTMCRQCGMQLGRPNAHHACNNSAEIERLKAHIKAQDERIVNQRKEIQNRINDAERAQTFVDLHRKTIGRQDVATGIQEMQAENAALRAQARIQAEAITALSERLREAEAEIHRLRERYEHGLVHGTPELRYGSE